MEGIDKVVNMSQEEIVGIVDTLNDEQLHYIAQHFSSGLISKRSVDADGFPEISGGFDVDMGVNTRTLTNLQKLCWKKYSENPQIRSYISDYKGGLTGKDFATVSDEYDIHYFIKELTEDVRNELFNNMPKYVARSEIEGELFLMISVHDDGFSEIDFIAPPSLTGGDNNSGIFFHPKKATMPLVYEVSFAEDEETVYIPSVYCAYIDRKELSVLNKYANFDFKKFKFASKNGHSSLNGFRRFMTRWDKGVIKKRNASHILCTLKWLDQYESLKNWEILHKKSSGSYLWVVEIEDTKAFKQWLAMSPQDKKDTGLYDDKTPGGTVILPPGLTMKCHNPNLPKISETDTDILQMAISGLNTTDHALTGKTQGSTFAGIKETGKTATDRLQNEISYFERFLRYDFWRHLLYFKSQLDLTFKFEYSRKEAWGFDEKGEPKIRTVKKKAYDLLDIFFPTSEVQNVVDKANAYLGSKHAAVTDSLGIPSSYVAKRLGFSGYRYLRLQKATEDALYPELKTAEESEAAVENASEPGKKKNPNKQNKVDNK